MTTTESKTLEKNIKEILDKLKKLGDQKSKQDYNKTLKEVNTKLKAIEERLSAGNSSDEVSAELISKVDKLSETFEAKSEGYIKEIQNLVENYTLKEADALSEVEFSDNSGIKDFVSIITNEMMEVKEKFEKFNSDFTDVSLNTGMAISKEIVSLKNYVLSLNDNVDNIKKKVEEFNPQEELVEPVSEGVETKLTASVEEVFNTTLVNFKNDVLGVIAKISEGIETVSKEIKTVSDNLKTFEGIELSLGEITQNQQKNKAELLKVFQNNIEEENKKLLPQIMQIVNSISFEESAEEIKDGLYAVNENLAIINKNVETGSNSTEKILNQIDDIANKVNTSAEEVTDVVKKDMADKISKISSDMESVSNEFMILTRGSKEDTGDYLYSLLDLESDISKVRVILDELNNSVKDDKSLAENVTKNISDKIANLNDFVEQVSVLYSSPDYKELLMQIDSLNDDITSISKRTNKLILTSDDASEKLQKNIAEFQEILVQICTAVKTFENLGILKTISKKADNIQKMLLASAQSDNAINEAFGYLANWIDSTSEEIKNISAELSALKQKTYQNDFEEIKKMLAVIKDTPKSQSNGAVEIKADNTEFEETLNKINEKLTNNEKRIINIESKLEKIDEILMLKPIIESAVEQMKIAKENAENSVSTANTVNISNKTLSKKIDKMEKQLQQLLSYVEEE